MTQTQYEEKSIKCAYSVGDISYEEYRKLMDDITPMLWDELLVCRENFYINEMEKQNEKV